MWLSRRSSLIWATYSASLALPPFLDKVPRSPMRSRSTSWPRRSSCASCSGREILRSLTLAAGRTLRCVAFVLASSDSADHDNQQQPREMQVVGDVESRLAAAAWSPDGEQLVLVTGQ